MKHFLKIFYTSQLLGILGVIFVLIVVVNKRGTATTSISKEFLWHPVLMSLSYGYLFGTSITIFRALRYIKKKYLKMLHAGIHLCVIAFAIGGLVTAFDMHYTYRSPHLRSLHSLIGIITVIFFCIQWVYSFLVFLYPTAPIYIRAIVIPHHVMAGLVLYVCATFAVITGISKYNSNGSGYLNSEGVLLNFAGFFFLINSLLIGFMVLKDEYKRKPTDEDLPNESANVS